MEMLVHWSPCFLSSYSLFSNQKPERYDINVHWDNVIPLPKALQWPPTALELNPEPFPWLLRSCSIQLLATSLIPSLTIPSHSLSSSLPGLLSVHCCLGAFVHAVSSAWNPLPQISTWLTPHFVQGSAAKSPAQSHSLSPCPANIS